ncbi:recombinase family protein [Pseudarthrobacter sp. R1]|uniref:recombinase family protein n=1 Tax=Pseudarthrobacter sp. R1 TaxID=2944934 RepID=UPI003F8DDDFD
MAAHRIGYARVSTRNQNLDLDLQVEALNKAGCDRSTKTPSAAPSPNAPVSTMLWTTCATVTLWWCGSWTAWAGGVKDLLDFAGGLNGRGVGFVSLTDAIDTTTVSGRFFFNVMASLAQMERELMVDRTQAGLQAAREQGRVGGRKHIMTHAKIRSARKLLKQGTPPREVADTLGAFVPTLYRWVPATGATEATKK